MFSSDAISDVSFMQLEIRRINDVSLNDGNDRWRSGPSLQNEEIMEGLAGEKSRPREGGLDHTS